jgi:hypothetical protein
MAYYFESLMRTLKDMGVADVLLPFLLIFTLVFAVLEKTKILGVKLNKQGNGETKRPKSNLNTVVALVMGLGVVIPHSTNSYPPGRDVVVILNNALPGIAMLVVAIFSFILLLGLWSGKQPKFMKSSTVGGVVVIIMALFVIGIFVDSANMYRLPQWLWFLRDPSSQAALIVIAVFAGLVWFITRDTSDNEGNNGDGFLKQLGKFADSDSD